MTAEQHSLADAGVTDLSGYGGGGNPVWDIFLDRP
jgi:citronellol/citronellal dehydrogenase